MSPWAIVASVGLGFVALAALFVGLVALRRMFILRRGGVRWIGLRLSDMVRGRGWAVGYARYAGDDMHWYRLFSYSYRPRRVFSRRALVIGARRTPDEAELVVLPADCVIIECSDTDASVPVELAMTRAGLIGFQSWMAAAPPGSASSRLG